ncbi:hypothetical protein B0H11DRAFT_1718378 [Mycena galericulata]|nr:hypothetical protein B0H11DRAFT_1718378 [Mycena galericulata]
MHRIRNILLAKKQASYPPLVRTSLLVPGDILLEIAHYLSISDVLKFSLTASHLRNLFLPVLYRDVSFSLNRTCTSGLRMLARRADVCTVIRGLTLHVNYADRSCSTMSEADSKLSPQWVVTMIERIAGDLKGLNKFWWVGGQSPPDGMWLVLRTSCPELKKIGCNTTTPWIESNTELFKFRNLTEFQLCINDQSAGNTHALESVHEIPNELWAMLIERCPNLEVLSLQLVFSSFSSVGITQITSGVFSKLHWLKLQVHVQNVDPFVCHPSLEALGRFLSKHPSIRELSLFPTFPATLAGPVQNAIPIDLSLEPNALPFLTSFHGTYQHMCALPNPGSVTLVRLSSHQSIDATSIGALRAGLIRFTALTSLYVCLADARHPTILRDIVIFCPGLIRLTLEFHMAFGMKTMKHIAIQLQRLPQLNRFLLLQRTHLIDETMLQSALLLFREGPPSLRGVGFEWFKGKARLQDGWYEMETRSDGCRQIKARENGVRASVVGGRFERRYTYPVEDDGFFEGVTRAFARMKW